MVSLKHFHLTLSQHQYKLFLETLWLLTDETNNMMIHILTVQSLLWNQVVTAMPVGTVK